ncbi:nitronate monooxygenase [Streptomyces sp. NBC_00280]|uniref:nitronate monooxygenase n=1 Tax=Streptomyces sp. NBC_00280 TaxID=2975699 RepID=UPI00324C0433
MVAAVRHAVAPPVIAAGGIATADDVTAVLRAGAVAAMVGTVLLRTRRADPTGSQAAAAALAASDGRSQVDLEPHRAWTNRRGATTGASIPPSAVGSRLPLA